VKAGAGTSERLATTVWLATWRLQGSPQTLEWRRFCALPAEAFNAKRPDGSWGSFSSWASDHQILTISGSVSTLPYALYIREGNTTANKIAEAYRLEEIMAVVEARHRWPVLIQAARRRRRQEIEWDIAKQKSRRRFRQGLVRTVKSGRRKRRKRR